MPQYVLIGKLKGLKSGYRGQFYFRDGVCNVTDSQTDEGNRIRNIAARLLPRDYAAYPPAIADEMHDRWLARQGKKNVEQLAADTVPESGPAETLASRANQAVADNGNNNAGAPGATTNGQTGNTRGAGVHNDGTGSRLENIHQALRGVDPDDDNMWTPAGLPKLEAFLDTVGADVKRDEIDQAMPGFNRSMAKQLKE